MIRVGQIAVLLALLFTAAGCGKEKTRITDSLCTTPPDDLVVDPGIDWITIEPGSFLMGSPTAEWSHHGNEQLHSVTLTHCFQIAATEVTRAQWQVLGFELPAETFCDCDLDDCPIECVTPIEMTEWLDNLSEANGLTPCYSTEDIPSPYHCDGFRLPTEAEWEYAARAGSQTATYNGDFTAATASGIVDPIAWCNTMEFVAHSVAQKEPSAWGLFDVLGNVAEVTSWDGVYPADSSVNPFGFADDDTFGYDNYYSFGQRGGSYDYYVSHCRAAARRTIDESAQSRGHGLRPVRTLPDSYLPDPPESAYSLCPEYVVSECEGEDPTPPELLVAASEVDEDARFVDMAVNESNNVALLGERTVDASTEPFLLVTDLLEDGSGTTSYPVEGSGAENAVAVTSAPVFGEQFVMLLCGADGCLLAESFATYLEPDDMVPIPGGEVPTELEPRSLSSLDTGVAVAGDGIAVFDGAEWSVVVEPGGSIFNRIWHSTWYQAGPLAAAVGENGRMVVRAESTWTEITSGSDADLYDVHIDFNPMTISAVGDGGVLVFGEMGDLSVCTIADDPISSVEAPGESPGYLDALRFATGSGQLVRWEHGWQGYPICFDSPVPEPVIKTRNYPCQLSENPLHLTETGLYGRYGCFND